MGEGRGDMGRGMEGQSLRERESERGCRNISLIPKMFSRWPGNFYVY